MKRNKSLAVIRQSNIDVNKRRIAYHEAGHAVAILINNELKQLPPLFFQINIYDLAHTSTTDFSAEVEGGRLINHVPESFDFFIEKTSNNHTNGSFLTAFIADIVNLLIGPLVEAKYMAINEGKIFNKNLISGDALHNYGGTSDLALINDYLVCFSKDKNKQGELLTEFIDQDFDFIDYSRSWGEISILAEYIINEDIETIDCNEIIELLSLH